MYGYTSTSPTSPPITHNAKSTTSVTRKISGPKSLTIWQYIFLGGPPQTCAAYSSLIFKHNENYVDINLLDLDEGSWDRRFSVSNKVSVVPLDHYGSSSDDVEGGSVDVIFSNSYPDSMSTKPAIVSILTAAALIVQLVAGTLAGMVVTLETPDNPYVLAGICIFSLVVFFALLTSSFYYWAIESQHKAYVPLVSANGAGTLAHVFVLFLFAMWTISESGLAYSVEYEHHPLMYIKYASICAVYSAVTAMVIAVYGYSMVNGYQKYSARFSMVKHYLSEQKKRERYITATRSHGGGGGGGGGGGYASMYMEESYWAQQTPSAHSYGHEYRHVRPSSRETVPLGPYGNNKSEVERNPSTSNPPQQECVDEGDAYEPSPFD